MEIIKDILKVEELKGHEEIETLVDAEIYLEQTRPDIENILWVDGKVEILSTKLISDKILINGLVRFRVVYRSTEEGQEICILETNRDFREEIEIEGISEDMMEEIGYRVEYIEYDLVDERRINLNAFIILWGRVEETNSAEIIEGIGENKNLQFLKEKIKYNDILLREEPYVLLKEAFEVGDETSAIQEVLKMDLHPYEKEVSISTDRIIVSGVMECSVIYFDGIKLNSIKREIPFTHFLEMDGLTQDTQCQIRMDVVEGEYEVRENIEGELKVLDIESKIKMRIKVYEQREKDVIVDAYSTSNKVELELEEITLMENMKDVIGRENILKELKGKGLKEVYAIEGAPSIIDSHYVDDKVLVEGILSLNIFCLEDLNDEIITLKEEIPYKSYITTEEFDKDVDVCVETGLEELNYRLKDDVLTIDGTVKNHIFIDRQRRIEVVGDIMETDELIDKKAGPSIIIYIIQEDDELWDISKRYNTTVEEIILANDIASPSTLMPGEKIIIEKKIDVEF
ncbi:MAG: DUF3794 domain-containing protein [Tissierellia bacterium]|nr:DUF3794 domain-containing protein [Tissierellia bacterium]